jgi:hypothetical protein
MKKIVSLLFAIVASTSLFAQTAMTASGGTVTNTGTGTITKQVTGVYAKVSVQAIFTKTSGTLAGTATLQGSVDGTNYVTVGTAHTVSGAATYTVTDTSTQSVIFTINGTPFAYYRVSWTGSGTMVGVISGYILVK